MGVVLFHRKNGPARSLVPSSPQSFTKVQESGIMATEAFELLWRRDEENQRQGALEAS